ncbi:ubiquitin-conjugating enzyme E2 J1 [Caerostris darwini]|uniref:Ubiquitin-conjugating enzyme E2 J1 n=1 Tax=Caerostris darwini TaxID=1538125 RepID=A0AAV4TXE2_9ARAC|nr:ubiquitin-conjugating enzyme E2 J1 [Caerostris darwini]
MARYNLKNPAVKRLMKEAEELQCPTEEYYAQPMEDNLFEWHFTFRGPRNSEFEGGIYHGRITLPPDYPMKPPSIMMLTPNGRFEINKKICLSISGYHPETWQPSWSIRTAILAIIGFLPTHGNGAIGSLDYTPEERKQLALKSQNWKCSECGSIKDCLKNPETDSPKKCNDQNEDILTESKSDENSVSSKIGESDEGQMMSTNGESDEGQMVSTNGEFDEGQMVSTNGESDEGQMVPTNGESDEGQMVPTNGESDEGQMVSTNGESDEGQSEIECIPPEISDQKNPLLLRQRITISPESPSESTQSDTTANLQSADLVQSAQAKPSYDYLSLILIWVISIILVALIVRRIYHEYSL